MAQRSLGSLRRRLAKLHGRLALAAIAIAKDDGGGDGGGGQVEGGADAVHIPGALKVPRRRRRSRVADTSADQGVMSVAYLQKQLAQLRGEIALTGMRIAQAGALDAARLRKAKPKAGTILGALEQAFDPEKHPRGFHGQFASTGGHAFTSPFQASGSNPHNSALLSAQKAIKLYEHHASNLDLGALHALAPKTEGGNPYTKAKFLAHKAAVAHVEQHLAAQAAHSDAPLQFHQLKQTGPQLGSNLGGKFEDKAGASWYVKQSPSNDHAANELLAAKLYQAAGQHTLTYKPVDLGMGHKGVATAWNDAAHAFNPNSPADKAAAGEAFATHAWLSNWDAVGLAHDNQKWVDGKLATVDTGGALLYRAQGTAKGAAFGDQALEWDTLRDATKNPQAAKVFGGMTAEQLQASAKHVESVHPDAIKALVEAHGPGDAKTKAALAATLIARRQDILDKAAALKTTEQAKPTASLPALHALAPVEHPPAAHQPVGALPQKPQASAANAGHQKHNDALEAHALKGDWAAVHGYEIKGVNSQWQKTAQYKAALLAHAGSGHAAPEAEAKPSVLKPAEPVAPPKPPTGLPAKPTEFLPGSPKSKAANAIEAHLIAGNAEGIKGVSNLGSKGLQAYKEQALAHLAAQNPAIPAKLEAEVPKPPAAPKLDPTKFKPPPPLGAPPKITASSKPAINAANQATVDHMHALASAGKLAELQAVESPSKAVNAYKATLVGQTKDQAAFAGMHALAVAGKEQELHAVIATSAPQHSYKVALMTELHAQLHPPEPPKQLELPQGKTLTEALDGKIAHVPDVAAVPNQDKLGNYVITGNPGVVDLSQVAAIQTTQAWAGAVHDNLHGAKWAPAGTEALTGAALKQGGHDAAFAALTAKEQQALVAYTDGSFTSINKLVKSLVEGTPNPTAKLATEALAKAAQPLQPGMVLSRKIGLEQKQVEQLKNAVGKALMEPAISSTSIDPNVWGVKNVQYRMTVGEGVKGLYVGNSTKNSQDGHSANKSEMEMLLPPGQQMIVQSVDKVGHGYAVNVLLIATKG